MVVVVAHHRGGTVADCDAGVSVGEDLILLDQTLPLLVHIDAARLTVVDAVVAQYRIGAAMNGDTSPTLATNVTRFQ